MTMLNFGFKEGLEGISIVKGRNGVDRFYRTVSPWFDCVNHLF